MSFAGASKNGPKTMREVVISDTVQGKIGELEMFLKEGLKMSKEAAFKRCNRMDDFFESLGTILCAVSKSGGYSDIAAPCLKRTGASLMRFSTKA